MRRFGDWQMFGCWGCSHTKRWCMGLTDLQRRSAAGSDGSTADLCLLDTMLQVQCMAKAGLATASNCLQSITLKMVIAACSGGSTQCCKRPCLGLVT